MSAHDELLALVRRHEQAARMPTGSRPGSGDVDFYRALPRLDEGLARRAAVLVLFGRLDDVPARHTVESVPADLDVLFVRRAATLRQHAGQIAFPGGVIDATDRSAAAAALREAEEETGLRPDGVEVLGTLPDAPLPVSNFLVTPVVGWWHQPTDVFAVDPGESAKVFRAPVADLLDPANRSSALVERGGARHVSPAFEVDGEFIWGFTGIVLHRIFDELGWTQPWDTGRMRPAPI